GRWNVLFGLYKISKAGCTCKVEIMFSKATTQQSRNEVASSAAPGPTAAGPRWLSGDLHVHSHHSDGELSVESVVREARRRGLDYVAITDHNTTSQWREVAQLVQPSLTVIVGEELTSYYGHANVWNSNGWLDFRMRSDKDARAVIDEAHRRRLLFSINHPTSLWPWDFRGAMDFDCMEIWSGLWFAMNAGSLQWWDALASEGRRVVAVGGSDFHRLEEPSAADIFSIGTPTTWIFSRDRSASAIIDGIRSGRVSISRGPADPCLILEGESSRGTVQIGGEIICMKGEEIKLRAEAHRAHGLGLRICSDEGYSDALPVDTDDLSHVIRTTAEGKRFLRAELVERDGDWRSAPPSEIEMVSLTNHVHIREK
ncbi:MAG TPA: CehA/McbA family metallohydrolase, partial [Thermoproteota archaeon]|nr:CehA/McbA family metallohydrolase [Thermoproteota archaeon]